MPRKLLCVLLAVSAVSEDSQSLLSIQSASNLTTKRIQYFQEGLCTPVSEQGSTKIQDNPVDFSGWRGATLDEVKFEPIWYSITPGQPVEERCLIDDEVEKSNRIKFLCGRYGSEEVAQDYLSPPPPPLNGSFLTSFCEYAAENPLSCANKYNFAIEGIMTFKFRSLEDFLVRKVRMRLAQWHDDGLPWSHHNIWSVLVMDECKRKIYRSKIAELRCGGSNLSIVPSPNNVHEFGVSPWPY